MMELLKNIAGGIALSALLFGGISLAVRMDDYRRDPCEGMQVERDQNGNTVCHSGQLSRYHVTEAKPPIKAKKK